jgi:shikimate kinase
MNIVLIGFRGTGKTVVGKKLAQRLGRAFIDADEYLEQKAGRSIAQIFAEGGEAAFREMEREVIQGLSNRDGIILAAGGGAVLDERNVENLKKNGHIFLLEADVDTIERRLASDEKTDSQRPPLTDKSFKEEIKSLLEFRRPYYERAADHKVNTSELSPEEVVQEILSHLSE